MPDASRGTPATGPDRRLARGDGGTGLACTVDDRATEAAATMLAAGGTAADAAVAANAVLAVTSPHLCGMGGDLWALVHVEGHEPIALAAAGRAGSGVDPDALRARGLTQMPFRGDPASVPVPGCVDGWLALHERFGRLALTTVLAPAEELAREGFVASELLALSATLVAHLGVDGIDTDLRQGTVVRRPGVAAAIAAIATEGREGFYGGPFGRGLVALGAGIYREADLATTQADWVAPIGHRLPEATVWTTPPPSQGYLVPAILHVAHHCGLPESDADPRWLRHLVAAAVVTGRERPHLLHDRADPDALLSASSLQRWIDAAQGWRPQGPLPPTTVGDTTYLCVRDGEGMAISLIQSNAADFGAHLVEPATGIFLHNRGVGFTLRAGHPAELAPGRRPPSTLSPTLLTTPSLGLLAVAGTMGGDSQPHLMAQHLSRLLVGRDPASVVSEPRWTIRRRDDRGFDLWADPQGGLHLVTDRHGVERWGDAAERIPIGIDRESWRSPTFGHANVIARAGDEWWAAAEPRVAESAAAAVTAR